MRSDCRTSRIHAAARAAGAVLFVVLALVCAPAAPRVFAAPPPATVAGASRPLARDAVPALADAPAANDPAEPKSEWLPLIAKIVNFGLLVGVLTYFLRTPLSSYLASRITRIRQDLVAAAEMRETAVRRLAEIETKLKALPAELEALKARGAEEVAAEQARIEQATEIEQQRVLEHTRREIEMRVRMAKRELVELAATLAVSAAAERIRKTITPQDQARLVEQYTKQLQEVLS